MILAKRRVVFGALVALGLSVGGADAQTVTPAARPDAEVGSRQTANLSGADQLREASSTLDSITASRRRVSDLLDRARTDRDIIKVNCLNDKLTQVDVTLRSAREHQELLQNSVSLNNDGQRNHEFTLMNIFRSRSETLETEARQCIGEETGTFDPTRTVITVRVDPSITDEDPTQLTPDSRAQ
jgi:oligoendopeptidase F